MLHVLLAATVSHGSSIGTTNPNCTFYDPRNIFCGTLMLQSGYLDQPYCVVNPATADWTCVLCQTLNHEGGAGERVISIVSEDGGATWSDPVPLEPTSTNSSSTIAISNTISPNITVHNITLIATIEGNSTCCWCAARPRWAHHDVCDRIVMLSSHACDVHHDGLDVGVAT